MRDPERIDRICGLLAEVWKQNPDWRLGQLIYNMVRSSKGSSAPLFYIEDDELESIMRVHLPNKENTGMEDKRSSQKVKCDLFGAECPRCGCSAVLPSICTFKGQMINIHCNYCYNCRQVLDWSRE